MRTNSESAGRAARRGITLLGLVTAATVALATVSATPAAALTGCTSYGCSGGWGTGYGYWAADGDKMTVCDEYADGYSVVVMADIGTRPHPDKWHTGGAGRCTERSYGDVAERQTIYFHTCLGKQSTGYILPGSCGRVVSGTT